MEYFYAQNSQRKDNLQAIRSVHLDQTRRRRTGSAGRSSNQTTNLKVSEVHQRLKATRQACTRLEVTLRQR
ncbi:hypothetical protein [Candidatus Enterovibrio escicola]|uniref:hypothetical protein n=1 Tax=Candidatus Enterovibrio escicola TaxID=1927127 RepID=UPI0012380C79|nr:hypothetical protein [Candidatus Enterovibrio escacola]